MELVIYGTQRLAACLRQASWQGATSHLPEILIQVGVPGLCMIALVIYHALIAVDEDKALHVSIAFVMVIGHSLCDGNVQQLH